MAAAADMESWEEEFEITAEHVKVLRRSNIKADTRSGNNWLQGG